MLCSKVTTLDWTRHDPQWRVRRDSYIRVNLLDILAPLTLHWGLADSPPALIKIVLTLQKGCASSVTLANSEKRVRQQRPSSDPQRGQLISSYCSIILYLTWPFRRVKQSQPGPFFLLSVQSKVSVCACSIYITQKTLKCCCTSRVPNLFVLMRTFCDFAHGRA